ncbi:ABC transporter substrate-binding protein [Bifidobacterium longum]|uniref:ABC transporter substrate-binding protein n=1 Tax=Bifidobacterium longum TaxID=216816 RepID=UPI000214C41F|nr:sugar ABC transporter substrate-binding protein [Bifidobacterium longum]AEI98263.1 ABC transporter substrate-binding protein [Bifidobacterium longum subsp. longum KACC 91563]MUV11576.1 extracellular solute-binding protein [Bifidobacterium longum]QGV02303.1 extracellular solute-binding protein [Bifidobacterium longum]QOL27888.1 sugar ABC transporter substrate-binding protein [Bifidobacterium longum subsp. longum]QOL30046.1 sugar ABC transporter substrate-binding protein [Bifidobacterium long
MVSFNKLTRTLAGIAAAALIVPLAACGGSGNGGTATAEGIPAKGTDDGTEITLWTRSPLERQAKNVVEAYNKSHKNQVKLEIIPNDDMEGKVGGASQTDSLPDILAGDVVRIPYWASEGIFTDITKQIDGLDNKADLQQGHIEAGTVDGAEYTLPFITDVSVMVWNKNLYKEAGLDPEQGPKSIDQFVEQAKKVAALNKDGVAGSYLAGQSGGALVFDLFPSVWADGESVMNKDGSEATLDNDSMKGVLDAYKELANTTNGLGAGSKEETGATWTAPFANGKIGVMPYPNTSTTALFDAEKDGGFEVGVAPIPGTKEGKTSTFLGGDAMGISKDSKHVAQAWDFLYWLMQSDAQKEVFADQGDTASNIQTLKTAYKDADPRIQTINSVIIDGNGQTPKSPAFNEAFNAAGSPWQLLVQNAVWGSGDLKADNKAVTDVLSAQ